MSHRAPGEVLLHRPPFLFLDEVVEATPEKLKAVRTFREDEDFFRGHFPGNPIVPGVLIIEAMAQALAYLLTQDQQAEGMLLTGIERARFRKPVRPNEQVEFLVELTGKKLGIQRGKGEARVNGERVAEAILTGKLKLKE